MSYSVRGFLDGVAYTVVVNRDDPDEVDGPVSGSPPVMTLLEGRVGDRVWATPTGPALVLSLDDDRSILAALTELTQVYETAGDVPQVLPPEVPGAVY